MTDLAVRLTFLCQRCINKYREDLQETNMHEVQNPASGGLKSQTKPAVIFLLALNLLCCSALHKNTFQKAKSPSSSDNPLGKTFREMTAASPKLAGEDFSVTKSAFADARALDELYDRFVTEVDFEIREGTARKNQKRVLSGLQNLQRMFSSVSRKPESFNLAGPGEKEASFIVDRADTLLDNHLMNFSEGKPTREDYRRVAEDYKSLMEGASKYFKAGFKQNEILQGLVRRKSRTAGAGFWIGGAFLISIPTIVVYLGLSGLEDEYLTGAIIQLNKYLKVCAEDSATEARKKYKNADWQKRFYRYLGVSYAHAEEAFCSQDPEAIDIYEDIFGDVDDNSRRGGDMCERIGALSSEDCFFREWLCENTKKLKACLQRKNIQIEWLSSG